MSFLWGEPLAKLLRWLLAPKTEALGEAKTGEKAELTRN